MIDSYIPNQTVLQSQRIVTKNAEPDKFLTLWHFVWIFPVCQSIFLGVSSLLKAYIVAAWISAAQNWGTIPLIDQYV